MWFERWWLPSNPLCRIRYEQLLENPPHELLGISQSEYLSSLDKFRLSEIAREMNPNQEIHRWFLRYGSSFRHLALTAVPLPTAPSSAEWVMRHFGRWIRSFHVIPSARDGEEVPTYDKTKGDYLRWLGRADLLVDDSPEQVASARALGIPALLVPRPWNGGPEDLNRLLDSLMELMG